MENTAHIMYVHKAYTKTPIILGNGYFGVQCLVTLDDQPIDEAVKHVLYFGIEEDAESIISTVNSSFEPIKLYVGEGHEEDE